jgi:transposase
MVSEGPIVADDKRCVSRARHALRPEQGRQAIAHSLTCWAALIRFLDDAGSACRTTPPRGQYAPSPWAARTGPFAGSDEGGRRAAAIYTLIQIAKLNDVDPQAWLADVLARISDHNIQRLDELLPWTWKAAAQTLAA